MARRKTHYVGADEDIGHFEGGAMHNSNGNSNFMGILDEEDDEEALQNIMVHLEEKQKKREQQKYGEDFESIKTRMAELLEEYADDSDNEEFDIAKLSDPDYFVSKETKEKNLTQGEINKLLDEYLEVCQDRADLLSNVYDALDFEEVFFRNLKSPVADDLDNVSSEISMTIDMIHQSSGKLSRLYNRLLKLYNEKSGGDIDYSKVQSELRQLDLQKQVINKFKNLQGQSQKRKEKVETWKFAANEIVDLLKSVRQEGATDFDQLEKEFKKLMEAFKQQTRMIEDHQDTISKQKAHLKKSEAMKEKLKNDNLLLQDEYDRARVQSKTVQMKCTKLEMNLKETHEKLSQVQNSLTGNGSGGNVDPTDDIATAGKDTRFEQLQMDIQNLEKQLKAEQQKNKYLMNEKKSRIGDSTTGGGGRSTTGDGRSTLDVAMGDLYAESEYESAYSMASSQGKDNARPEYGNPPPSRKKCMKCTSYRERLEEVTKDLQNKREQIVQLSKRMIAREEEKARKENLQEEINLQKEINQNKIHQDVIQQVNNPEKEYQDKMEKRAASVVDQSVKNITERYALTGEKPIPPNPNTSFENLTTNSQRISSSAIEQTHSSTIIRSSTKQIVVYQQISLEKEEILARPHVWDQSTQTDFPMDRPVIMRQRGSVPTQAVVAKNYSTLVDEDIKGMAGRIYNYVNTIDQPPHYNEDIPHEEEEDALKNNSSGEAKEIDQISNTSSSSSRGDVRSEKQHVKPNDENDITNEAREPAALQSNKEDEDLHEKLPNITVTVSQRNVPVPNKPNKTNPISDVNNPEVSVSNETSKTNTKQASPVTNQTSADVHPDPIKRRGNESGFFDESAAPTSTKKEQQEEEQAKKRSKWNVIRAGVVSHVMRFLNNTAKSRCSHLHQAFQQLDPIDRTDEEIVKAELNVFAEHAIDMLDVISYCVKQMNECHKMPTNLQSDYDNLTVRFQESWHPHRAPPKSPRNVKFIDERNKKSQAAQQQDTVLPEILKQSSGMPSAKAKSKKSEEDNTAEMKARVAEKKRLKILERHKKLVTKLRQSGVGLKEIYTILGIQTA